MTLPKNLGYEFRAPVLLEQALTHSSFHNENPAESKGHNERLEFLGDAVLDLIISEKLFSLYPDLAEGDLSKLRASLVNETSLAEISRKIELGKSMRLGRGEEITQGCDKPRLLACTFEAIVGAIYLDGQYDKVKEFVLELFKERLESGFAEADHSDFKTRLQEKTQKMYRKTPVYELLNEEGPDHEKTFKVCVKVDDKVLGEGLGRSKKTAEQEAAQKALQELDNGEQV